MQSRRRSKAGFFICLLLLSTFIGLIIIDVPPLPMVRGAPITITINDPDPEYYNDTTAPIDLTVAGNTSDPVYNVLNHTYGWVYGANQTYAGGNLAGTYIDGMNYTLYVYASNATDTEVATGRFAIDVDGYKSVSGTNTDIQDVVDEAIADGAGDRYVYLPAGTFTFDVANPRVAVNVTIAARTNINIVGALTERDANDDVTLWRTILNETVFPDSWYPTGFNPGSGTMKLWFNVQGDGNVSFRISDIQLLGWRDAHPTSNMTTKAINIFNVVEFRIDHCNFEDLGSGIGVSATDNAKIRGVIDHNRVSNDAGTLYTQIWNCSVLYGVQVTGPTRGTGDINQWNYTDNIMGNYLNYTVFIENNYFQRWRHVVAANHHAHYVFRFNTVNHSTGYGEIDAHGSTDGTRPGTRYIEVYNNSFMDPIKATMTGSEPKWTGILTKWRGGSGLFYNNYIKNFLVTIQFTDEGNNGTWYPHDAYIWNNTYDNCSRSITSAGGNQTLNYDYFLDTKPLGYTAYPYPHPLVSGSTFPPVWQIKGGLQGTKTNADGNTESWNYSRGINTTTAGGVCLFSVRFYDYDGLPANYTLEHNNSAGTFQNVTNPFGAEPWWGNQTLTLNSTVGNVVAFRWIANGSSTVASPFQFILLGAGPPSGGAINVVTHDSTLKVNFVDAAGAGANLTYTELASAAFAPAGSAGWEDYDIFNNFSVPKGAVAEILIGNKEVDTENEGGVRMDGSALARLIDLIEAEDGGVTWVSMLVQVDSSTGLIEIYAENATQMEFRCVGYFTGCTFAEAFNSWQNVADGVWEDKDLFTDYGTPKERVVQIISGNTYATARRAVGIRTDGSIVNRRIFLQEAEDGGVNPISWIVESDTDGEIESYAQVAVEVIHYYMGYFSSGVNFTEARTSYAPAGDAGWENEDLSGDAVAPPANGVVYWALTHHSEGAENEIGVRDNGSALARKYDEREAEGTPDFLVGFGITVNIDTNKICEVYSEVAAEAVFYYLGYFSGGTAEAADIEKINAVDW